MQTENEKQFKIGKAAAKAQAVIDTIASAQSAYKSLAGIPVVGPALGAVAAGAAVVAGMKRVQQINSQQMGGGSVPASAGGGGSVSSASAPMQSGGGTQGGGQTLFVEGLTSDQMFSGTMVRDLVSKIEEYKSDGGKVVLI